MLRGLIEVGQHGRPVVADVVGGAPQISDTWCPIPWLVQSPLTDAEHDRSSSAVERIAELPVLRGRIESAGVAPIFLHVIDAPARVRLRVALLEAQCTGSSLTGFRT